MRDTNRLSEGCNHATHDATAHVALPRRDWLKAAGLALLSAPALSAAADADGWQAKAKKNIKLAIMADVYAGMKLEEAAKRIREDGFVGVVTNYTFADARFDPAAPDWKVAERIVGTLDKHGIKIVGVFGYVNLVDPVEERRKKGLDRLEFLLQNWKRLGCPYVCTETGTLNRESQWSISPENATEGAYLQCRAALEKLAKTAEKAGAVVAIEPYWQNIIDSIDRAERLFREVKSPGLRLIMDPCNYFRKEDLPRMKPMLEDMFRRLGSQIVVAHAKDVKAAATGTALPAAGQGVLDYPLFLRLLAELDREMYLVVEHLTIKDVARARDFVLSQMGQGRN